MYFRVFFSIPSFNNGKISTLSNNLGFFTSQLVYLVTGISISIISKSSCSDLMINSQINESKTVSPSSLILIWKTLEHRVKLELPKVGVRIRKSLCYCSLDMWLRKAQIPEHLFDKLIEKSVMFLIITFNDWSCFGYFSEIFWSNISLLH